MSEAELAYRAFLLTMRLTWEIDCSLGQEDRREGLLRACELLRELRDSETTIRDPGLLASLAPTPELAERFQDSTSEAIGEDRELARLILSNLPEGWFPAGER